MSHISLPILTRHSSAASTRAALGAVMVVWATGQAFAADTDTIHIASSAPLTGPAAAYGIETMNGLHLAIDEINKAGGIGGKQIELTELDDQCDPTQAATAANRIISDRSIVAVVGNVCSSATLAQMPIFGRVKLPVIAATASSPALSKKGFANFARIIPNDDLQGAGSVQLGTDVLGYKKLAVLYPSDDYGQVLLDIAKDTAAKTGGEIVASETYVSGSTNDFSSLLANVAAAKPDALFLAGYYADMGAAVSQSVRAFGGEKIPLLANAQTQVPEYVDLAGKAAEGTWVTNVYDVHNPSPQNQAFVSAYEATFDATPGVQAAAGYDNIYVLKQAIEDNGGETSDLMPAILASKYDGAMGPIRFDETGDNTGGALVVLQLKNGSWDFDETRTEELHAD
ncbi:ABC transporter substrate-binding protein [Thioclava sp. GXIMD2076]|uniref:ABC transporter substrate-binding protein n=1 Tax=Thioclava sp. GXIMD2076 TaxID=3131931 RepID=UPI0030D54BE5